MRTRATIGLAIGLCIAFLANLSLLHVLEPKFNPPHLISEYQLGRFGWLMSLAFFNLGVASLALFAAARRDIHSKPGRFGSLRVAYHRHRLFRRGHLPSRSKMARRQPASRHLWTGHHLRLTHRVHAREGLRPQRGVGNGRTIADLDGHFDVADFVFVLRIHRRFLGWTRLR
jgi:hypothetical protein